MKNLSSLPDEEIVRLTREKDQELYQEIMTRYQKKLLRYANYLVNDQDLAADAVQQGFVKAYLNLNSFKLNKKFGSWLYRIVHNEAMNLVKKEKPSLDLSTQFSLKSSEDVEDHYAKKELAKLTCACLLSIPLKYREPLTLYFLEGYSYQEISDILRLPVSTVGVRLSRGKKYLKEVCQIQNQ
jgi:RNA polymerase sigma-70 factor (ECF subfamily)